jgi:hypothetical protein
MMLWVLNQPKVPCNARFEVSAIANLVHETMLAKVFRGLEPLGQILPHRFSDDARSGKSNKRAWFGDVDIAQHGEGSGNASRGGVG